MVSLFLAAAIAVAQTPPAVGPPAAPTSIGTAAPAAAPAATPGLPTIGRTRSKTYCSTEIARTNGSIAVVLKNDEIVQAGVDQLRSVNPDDPSLTLIAREKMMRQFREVGIALQKNAAAGSTQVADLRALAKKEPDFARADAVRSFANTIDDAISRQRSIGADMMKMLTIVEGRYAHQVATGMIDSAFAGPNQMPNGNAPINGEAAHGPIDRMFLDAADIFNDRMTEIGKAEDHAAVQAPAVLESCR